MGQVNVLLEHKEKPTPASVLEFFIFFVLSLYCSVNYKIFQAHPIQHATLPITLKPVTFLLNRISTPLDHKTLIFITPAFIFWYCRKFLAEIVISTAY